jgi:hypothetical protein
MDKIDNLIILIDKYTGLIKQLIDKNKSLDRKKDLELFVKIIFLERFYYNSGAIKALLELFKNDHNYKFPLGLLLRTGLSDFLTYSYFLLIVKENYPDIDLINNEIKQFLAGNIHSLKREIDWNLSNKKITNQQRDEAWQNIKRLYDDYFDPLSGKLINDKNIRISDIKKKLEKHQDLEWAAFAYERYAVFSKYEHVGALTYDLQKVHLQNVNFDINGIIMSTIHIYWGVEAIVKSMNEYQDLKVIFDELNKDWLKL